MSEGGSHTQRVWSVLHPYRGTLLHQNRRVLCIVIKTCTGLGLGEEQLHRSNQRLESAGMYGGLKGGVEGYRDESLAGHISHSSGTETGEIEALFSRGLMLAST